MVTRFTFFFFFKQKTAYEISTYWSSDVCSSDLSEHLARRHVLVRTPDGNPARAEQNVPSCLTRRHVTHQVTVHVDVNDAPNALGPLPPRERADRKSVV